MIGEAVAVIGLGVVMLVAGVLGITYRERLDDANMRLTPRWMKPPGDGGEFSPRMRPFRIKSQTIAMAILAIAGLGLAVLGITHL